MPEFIHDQTHQDWLRSQARAQFEFFAASINPDGGFYVLDAKGAPLAFTTQELHTTTRLVHSYSLGKQAGFAGSDAIIDQGVRYLWDGHRDADHGGYAWGVGPDGIQDGRKLAYGHVFVLLAAAAATHVGHPDAAKLLDDIDGILDQHFWDEDAELFVDEYSQDWSQLLPYRGMNANMHGVEALLTAYEVTGNDKYLTRAGRILAFFFDHMAPTYGWRLPEHYSANWTVDVEYAGDPMFKPAGTTPGHSFELGRLLLQYWDLSGRTDATAIRKARCVIYRALEDAWNKTDGGFAYTLRFDGTVDVSNRYWWPLTEAIGALAALMKVDPQPVDQKWYNDCWTFAQKHFIDETGGWIPEIDADGKPDATQFAGKPDIYHAIQGTLLPLVPGVSRLYEEVEGAIT
ncbi:AGE family epimerase/isomerase [Actibacterium pelagium]|uniref:Mannose-6-phosphate isomerase n=1 Tax=Actibacterium pelagium TaxID=2029103 RepID=A0A917AIZ7_9RHOB|nr:AGE family epimerase/isomerase [Actibacterium pelagium]GGE54775.1 mannose-6-phosphate isomerase [Actibacterium pelagium]